MEKLLLTTYRKLWKMCSRIDGSLVLRSTLVCGATVMYEPISGGWIPIDESFFRQVPESEYYLNALMRRLNNGRQYYIPPTTSELEAVKLRYGDISQCGRCDSSNSSDDNTKSKTEGNNTTNEANSDATSGKESAKTDAKATATEAKEKVSTTTKVITDKAGTNSRTEVRPKLGNSSSNTSANSNSNSKKDFVLPDIPPNIAPFSKLQHVLRYLFETTPFSSSKLNNVFTAVKLLNCLSAGVDKSKGAIHEVSHYLCKLPVPHLERQLEPIAMDGIFLVQGLTPELRRSLQAAATAARRREVIAEARSASACNRTTTTSEEEEEEEESTAKNKNVKPGIATEEAFDITMQSVRSKDTSTEKVSETKESESKSSTVAKDKAEGNVDSNNKENNTETAAQNSDNINKTKEPTPSSSQTAQTVQDDSSNSSSSNKNSEKTSSETSEKSNFFTGKVCKEEIIETLRTPSHVQLLLAHPMLHGFFWRTVQLLVSNTDNEAAAFVINRPLMNDKGVLATVETIVRYSRVHPIFARFLSKHTIMVGGPVMVSGSVYESIFLLHRVPGVPKALPISDNLWIDGDLDVLMAKLENHEASVEDVVVLCGFAGWGKNQLKGEVAGGTWIVAASEASDANVDSFVINIARAAGAFTLRNKPTPHTRKNNVNNTNVDQTNTEPSKELVTEVPASEKVTNQNNDNDNKKVESAASSDSNSSDAEATKETKTNTTQNDDDSQTTRKCEESSNKTGTSATYTSLTSSEGKPIENKRVVESQEEGKIEENIRGNEQTNEASNTNDESSKVDETKTDVKTSQGSDGSDKKIDERNNNDHDGNEKNGDSDDSDKDVYEEISPTEECEQPTYIFGVKNRWNWVNRHVTYSWAWAYEVLGEPYKGLNKNQLREVRETDDDEESSEY